MELAAPAKVLSCHLTLLCLLCVCLCSGTEEAASLCNSFKVSMLESGQWTNEVTGLLNKKTFFLYMNNKCHAIGDHGYSTNATEICEKQVDTLKHGVDIFKGLLLHIKEENETIRGPLTLQAEMCCHYEGDRHFRGSWSISLNRRNMFHVDTSTGNWTEMDPRFKKIIGTFKKEKDVAAFLNRTTQGDCRTWLEELNLPLKESLEPTETTIKTLDRIQHTSDNSFVIILCTLPAIGLIIFIVCYVSRYLCKRKINLQSPPLLSDSLTLPETCPAKKADELLTASQNSLLLTLDESGGKPGD
ncbi:UL16-binding protein 1-like [Arvicanthis niloticus]|uniref:UL16-binding protein 1-like n=1 Tax=Arvicanthis niloticus TaxID=61156 RepID=UPI00402BC06B